MRVGLAVLGIVLCLGLLRGWLAGACERATTAALGEEARIAMEVGCRGYSGREARDCRALLRKLYLSGSLDPDKTLRAYCDAARHARWGGGPPPPPKLCVERYGGWRQG